MKEDQVLNATKVKPGVIIARSIINPKQPFLKIINTTSHVAKISNVLPKSENLSNISVYSIDEINMSEIERKKKIADSRGGKEF